METAGDHKGPPNRTSSCSLASTATTLSRLVLRTQAVLQGLASPLQASISPKGLRAARQSLFLQGDACGAFVASLRHRRKLQV